jgi:hypothetical protein
MMKEEKGNQQADLQVSYIPKPPIIFFARLTENRRKAKYKWIL